MTLSLVIHRPDAGPETAETMRAAVRDAVWEVADAHWTLGTDLIFVSCDLSPDYLLNHFRRALARRNLAAEGTLLVTALGPRTAWAGLPQDAEEWLRGALS